MMTEISAHQYVKIKCIKNYLYISLVLYCYKPVSFKNLGVGITFPNTLVH